MPINFPSNPGYGSGLSSFYSYSAGGINQSWYWGDTGDYPVEAWIPFNSNAGGLIIGAPGSQGPQGPTGPNYDIGSISGNIKESGVARWQYTVFSAEFNGSSWVIQSPSITATNLLEVGNIGKTAYGISVTGNDGITLSGFSGFALMPVPNGTLVEMTHRGGKYFFSAPNPIDGKC